MPTIIGMPDIPPLEPALRQYLLALVTAIQATDTTVKTNVSPAAIQGIIPIATGGTGATTAPTALTALGAAANLQNPGTGTNTRPIATILADYANVNDYRNTTDTAASWDGAITRALADKGKVYFPKGTYTTTATITLNDGQVLVGDGSGSTIIQCSTNNVPVVTLGQRLFWVAIKGLTIKHSVTAIAGGDGIYMAQGLNDWVNNGYLEDVQCNNNYIGWNLGKCFICYLFQCQATGNVNDGFRFTTSGRATGASFTNVGGPLQWVLINPSTGSNGNDGYAYYTANQTSWLDNGGVAASGAGSSVGTLYNPVTFANGHHGIAAYGNAIQPLDSVRVLGGFIGQDAGTGIYLDTYARDHVIKPDFIELSGAYNCRITINNANVTVQIGQCGGAWFDGLRTEGENTIVVGGNYVNNGLAGVGVENFAGIQVFNGTCTITGVTSQNFNSTIQQYGIRASVDTLVITGCRLSPPGTFGTSGATVNGALLSAANIGNANASIGGVALTNSIITGCFPSSINNANTLPANVRITGTLQVDKSIGVGTAPSVSVGNITSTTLNVSAASAFAGGVNVTGVGIAVSAGAGGLVVDNITSRISLGVGVGAPGTTGTISATAGLFSGGVTALALTSNTSLTLSGSVTGATSISMNGALTGATTGSFSSTVAVGALSSSGAVSGTTITSSADLIANGQFHANGATAFAAGVNVTGGGMTFSAGVASNGITVDNIQVRTSVGVGANLTAIVGRISVSNGVDLNGTLYVNP